MSVSNNPHSVAHPQFKEKSPPSDTSEEENIIEGRNWSDRSHDYRARVYQDIEAESDNWKPYIPPSEIPREIPRDLQRAHAYQVLEEDMSSWQEYQPSSSVIAEPAKEADQVFKETFPNPKVESHIETAPPPSPPPQKVETAPPLSPPPPQNPEDPKREALRKKLMALGGEYQIDDEHFNTYYEQYAETLSHYTDSNPGPVDSTTLCKILIKAYKTFHEHGAVVAVRGKAIEVDGKHYIIRFADRKLHIIDPHGKTLGQGSTGQAVKVYNYALGKFEVLKKLQIDIKTEKPTKEENERVKPAISRLESEQAKIELMKNKGVTGVVNQAHLVKVFVPEVGWVVGNIMEEFDGDLWDFMSKTIEEDISLKMQLSCCMQVTQNIINVEKAGLVHNDIKLLNYLYKKGSDGSEQIRVVASDYDHSTKDNEVSFSSIIGTPAYYTGQDRSLYSEAYEDYEKVVIEYNKTAEGSPEREALFPKLNAAIKKCIDLQKAKDTYSLAIVNLQILLSNSFGVDDIIDSNRLLVRLKTWCEKLHPGNEKLLDVLTRAVTKPPLERPTKEEMLEALKNVKIADYSDIEVEDE